MSACVVPLLGGGTKSATESTESTAPQSKNNATLTRNHHQTQRTLENAHRALQTLRKQKATMIRRVAAITLAIDMGTRKQDDQLVDDLQYEMNQYEKEVSKLGMGLPLRYGNRLQQPHSNFHGQRMHPSHQLSLLDVAHEHSESLLTLQQLASEIQDTHLAQQAASLLHHEVKEVSNQHCIHNAGMTAMLSQTQATEDETGVRDDVLYVRLETDREDDSDSPVEPLFNVQAKGPRYQATGADLTLQNHKGERALAKGSVVDSGATRCAIDYAHLTKWFPGANICSTAKRFHDASGNRMNIAGEIDLAFWMGDLLLWTTVYVFHGLGAPFLLGVNAIHKHGLAISSVYSKIFSEAPNATPNSKVPISMTECEPTEAFLFATDCSCRNARIMCDLDTMQISAKTHRADSTQACYSIQASDVRTPMKTAQEKSTSVHVTHRTIINPGDTVQCSLTYKELCKGKETTAEVTADATFLESHPDLRVIANSYHSTMNAHAHVRIKNVGTTRVRLKADTFYGSALYHSTRPKMHHPVADQIFSVAPGTDRSLAFKFKVVKEYRASPKQWHCLGDSIPSEPTKTADGSYKMHHYREMTCPKLATALAIKTEFTDAEWKELTAGHKLLLTHCICASDGKYYAPMHELAFEDGGRPRNIDDLHAIGLSLEKAIDPSKPKLKDGTYPPLADELKRELYEVALEFWYVWSRDARAPELSRLVVIEIPTGDAHPITQKPYPLPYAYLEAVRDELQKLIDGGLVEPCISNWASPVLVRLKKDSTPEKIRLKLICDFRRLNEVTVPDAAGLGDQDEILDGFGGDQRWAGIVDAAGGFYQCLIHPKDRHKTAICLPTSMGGTQFQWRVAPYGLTRNPAGYSRGMMFALKGLNNCVLDSGHARGGTGSWIDDISMHANSFQGFKDLFRRILTRLAFAGMSLKATKCYLLHQQLEVLGFFVTPDGIIMQPDAIDRIEKFRHNEKDDGIARRDEDGNIVGPRSIKEIRTFLGAVQFYRRFVPRIAMLAAPMNELLKKQTNPNDPRFRKGTEAYETTWNAVQQSFEAIMLFLRSSAVMAAPDLRDPLAEYIIVCDACDIAAGGALLQWQHPSGNGPGPPAGTPMRGGVGPDPIVQSWRLDVGWKLRTIGYFHKTFNPAQINYSTFDQEGAAILTCCRRWAKLITSRPTTIYTDSAVAATMLLKHQGTQRLTRWGIEIGTFMPYLKIQHRKGSQNGLADFISRYPTFERYVKRERDELKLPPSAYNRLATVPLFTHEVADENEAKILGGWEAELYETSVPSEAEKFWHQPANTSLITATLESCHDSDAFLEQIQLLRETVRQQEFWDEQLQFDKYVHQWDVYSDIFQQTANRKPILWDLCCGEGGYSRGARHGGFECYGFDVKEACRTRYENDPTVDGTTRSGMVFTTADIMKPEFWYQLTLGKKGTFSHIPAPDVIHVSPDCVAYSHLRKLGSAADQGSTETIDFVIRQLKKYERHCATQFGRHTQWQVENVVDSQKFVTEPVDSHVKLCGTMMGHQTFRHRIFYCNYTARTPQCCRHEGKYVGTRGVRFNMVHNVEKFAHLPDANMYGIYSRPYAARGTADEWHGALGHVPGNFSEFGLRGALPVGYGRLLSGQALAHLLNRQFGCPILPPDEREPHEQDALDAWACNGYKPLSEIHYLGDGCPGVWRDTETPDNLHIAWPGDYLTRLHTDTGTKSKLIALKPLTDMNAIKPPWDYLEATPEPPNAPTTELEPEGEQPALAEIVPATPTPTDGSQPTPTLAYPSVDVVDAEENADNPYHITRQDQLSDAMAARLIITIEHSTTAAAKALDTDWELQGGRLYRLGTDTNSGLTKQLYVPSNKRVQLLYQYHYSNHRGQRPLLDELSKSYYWPNMTSDCTVFVATCNVCGPLASRPLNKVATNPIPTPERPFTVLHVDHADFRGRTSGPMKFQHILVVTCALTRFTLFIPVTSTTAEETLKALNAKVFSIFGPPLIVVSDNGPAFISGLSKTCAKFWGYRHVHILPYNSQANGVAESAVKRIKLLLDRHCQGHKEWHVQLPLLQLKLNTDRHMGTGVSAHAALFGRDPVGIEQLEDPSLYPTLDDGDGFLRELPLRIQRAHATLREHSDALKKAHAEEQNRRMHASTDRCKHGIVEASTADEPKYAWLIHGSKAQAAYMAKHGHGLPWKHKYKVLEARPHAVRLEVPTDGSVPRVNEWQLRRRVARAPANSHDVDDSAPIITESGLMMPAAATTMDKVGSSLDGDPYAGDEAAYEIEAITHAERIGSYYKVWIKWVGSEEPTWRWRHELSKETSNPEVLKWMDEAVTKERDRRNTSNNDYAQQEEEDVIEVPGNDEEAPLGRGAPRARAPPAYFMFMLAEDHVPPALELARSSTLVRISACMAYLSPSHEYLDMLGT